jgi:uncharacterized protein YpbB
MNYLLLITLYGLEKINGERSIYSIYHLLKGKRSSQTIQDARLFKLSHLFGIIPDIKRKDLERAINQLHAQGTVKTNGDGHYQVTKSGREALSTFHIPVSLDGWSFSSYSAVFWERLSLTIQCLSHLIHRETRFIPIHREPSSLNWVKSFLRKQSGSRELIAEHLHGELFTILKQLDEKRATIFVHKLTSYQRVGLTNQQIAERLTIDTLELTILFLSTLHYFLALIEKKKDHYPLLSQMSTIVDKHITLTQSTFKTYELLQMGKTTEEIARIRSLKKNTIEDHIVEIVLMDDSFDISTFITLAKFNIIKDCIDYVKTNQLKLIKEHLPIPASYFEIRLVLAKVGGAYAT